MWGEHRLLWCLQVGERYYKDCVNAFKLGRECCGASMHYGIPKPWDLTKGGISVKDIFKMKYAE